MLKCCTTVSLQALLHSFCCSLSTGLWFAAYQWDYVFDWTVLKYQQSQATRRVHREPTAAGNNTTPEEDEEGRIK